MKIGVDVDGTVAAYGGSKTYRPGVIGEPLPRLAAVRDALKEGQTVSWWTHRGHTKTDREALRRWSRQHLGRELPIVDSSQEGSEAAFDELWDAKFPGGKRAMPPVSQAQRGLFYAAKGSPEVRKRTGISKKVADEAVEEDPGGKLPEHVAKMRGQRRALERMRR